MTTTIGDQAFDLPTFPVPHGRLDGTTDTAAPEADITASEVAWDLSTLASGASMSTPAEVVNRTEAITAGLLGVIVVKTGSRRTPG